ncbi:MAG TPA: MBL fold metallo-hydrolase, partial [Aquifex sp.]|nr:MBL fold metallo-hydrolase [Aquifex sp.]
AQYLNAQLNPPVDRFLKEGDSFKLGNLTLEVYETPGHTPGGVVYYIPQLKILIAGDLLFRGSVGRWNLPGGNKEELINSVRRVLSIFPEDTKVITGHGELTTIGFERKHNPLGWGL